MHVAFSNHFCLSTRIRTFLKTAFSKNRRPHVAFSNRFCLSTTFDIIVFEILRFPLSLRLQKVPGLKKSTVWRPFSECSGFGYLNTVYVWTEAVSGEKKLRFQNYPDTCGQGLKCPKFMNMLRTYPRSSKSEKCLFCFGYCTRSWKQNCFSANVHQ